MKPVAMRAEGETDKVPRSATWTAGATRRPVVDDGRDAQAPIQGEARHAPRLALTETFSTGRLMSLRPAKTSDHLASGAQKKMVLREGVGLVSRPRAADGEGSSAVREL